jgi:hypothetical protein
VVPTEEIIRPQGYVAQQLGQGREQHRPGVGVRAGGVDVERVQEHVAGVVQVRPQVR